MESSSESESFHSSGSSSLDFAELEDHDFDFEANKINVGDFLLVKFCTKTNLVHYVGRVEKELDDGYEIHFLRKRGSGFIFPNVPDIATIQQQDVVLKLPSPFKSVASGRLFSVMYFDVDLSNFLILKVLCHILRVLLRKLYFICNELIKFSFGFYNLKFIKCDFDPFLPMLVKDLTHFTWRQEKWVNITNRWKF